MGEAAATFLIGAVGYGAIEILWQGSTHWTMLLTGGVCLLVLRHISRLMLPFPLRCLLGGAAITGIELVVGILCTHLLHCRVWDYSCLWGNFMGYICPLYSFLWLLLCIPIMAIFEKCQKRGSRS